MIKQVTKNLIFAAMAFGTLTLGYQWEGLRIKFLPSTLLIIATSFLFFRVQCLHVLGLKASQAHIAKAFSLMIIVSLLAYPLIQWSLETKGYALALSPYIVLASTVLAFVCIVKNKEFISKIKS